jgi:hypothetical protein
MPNSRMAHTTATMVTRIPPAQVEVKEGRECTRRDGQIDTGELERSHRRNPLSHPTLMALDDEEVTTPCPNCGQWHSMAKCEKLKKQKYVGNPITVSLTQASNDMLSLTCLPLSPCTHLERSILPLAVML